MFASNSIRPPDEEERKDIFAPVADLMVGVVFIFIILMFALSLNFQPDKVVPRSDYERLQHQNEELARQYEQERTVRVEAEQKLAQAVERNRSLEEQSRALTAQNQRLAEFARFVKESNVKSLLERLSKADETRSAILSEMKQKLSDAGIAVNVNLGAGSLSLPSTSLFASGQADPTVPNGRDTILRLGTVMSQVLPCYTADAGSSTCGVARTQADFSSLSAVYVEGHTDVTPFAGSIGGRFRDNWDLSAARAIEAYKLIRDSSEVLRVIRNSKGETLVGVSGYADTRPASPNEGDRTSPAAKDQDRRIEIRVIMSTNEQKVEAVLEELNQRLEAVDGLIR